MASQAASTLHCLLNETSADMASDGAVAALFKFDVDLLAMIR